MNCSFDIAAERFLLKVHVCFLKFRKNLKQYVLFQIFISPNVLKDKYNAVFRPLPKNLSVRVRLVALQCFLIAFCNRIFAAHINKDILTKFFILSITYFHMKSSNKLSFHEVQLNKMSPFYHALTFTCGCTSFVAVTFCENILFNWTRSL